MLNNNYLNDFTMWITKYLKDNNEYSLTNYTLFNIVLMTWIIILSISAHIIIASSKHEITIIDWLGIAAVLTSLGIFISPAIIGKYKKQQLTKIKDDTKL